MSDLFREVINEMVDEDSQVSQAAKAQGLEYMKFGRYGKDGKVTHKSQGGKLVAVKPQDTGAPVSGAKAKSTKQTPQDRFNAAADKSDAEDRAWAKEKGDAEVKRIKQTYGEPKHTSVSAGTVPYKKSGNIYRSVSDSIESSGFSSMNSADSKALIKNGMVPLKVKGAAPRTWKRGDGAQHKDWTTIEPSYDWNGVDKVVKKDPQAVSKTLNAYIEKIGAKPIGQVSGEFGSSKMNDVYAAGDTIFVHRGNRIEVGNKKRFKNDKVWRKP